MCFLRDLSQKEAVETFTQFLSIKSQNEIPNLDKIIGIGLDSSEINNPPEKFTELYKLAKENNFRLCCHCHDEGSLEHIKTAVNTLKVERIDHGIDISLEEEFLQSCTDNKTPFTFCPLSTLKVQRVRTLEPYKIKYLLNKNLLFSINSDDPGFFRGYIGDNYLLIQKEYNLKIEELSQIAENSINSTFLSAEAKTLLHEKLNKYLSNYCIKNN